MSKRPVITSPCSIICHGASEFKIAKFLKQEFRLPINIISKQNGKQPIELTSIKEFINRGYLADKELYIKAIGKEYLRFNSNNDIVNHKIFILLDVDAHVKEAQEFETKQMFKNHWAKDLIVPILAKDNLDEVFFKGDKSFNKNCHKPEQYDAKLFSIKTNLEEFFNSIDKKRCNIALLFEFLKNYR